MALTDFTIIRRSMSSRLFSTITTVLTVAVAVGLMLVLLSMRHSGRKAFERGSGNMHLLVSADSNALTAILNGVFYANPPQRPITWSKYNELVNGIFGSRGPDGSGGSFAVPVQMGDSYQGHPVCATTAEFFSRFKPDPQFGWQLAAGRFFEREFEVVAGSAAARAANIELGQRMVLSHGASNSPGSGATHVHDEFRYTVVGILEPTGSAHDRALFTNLESAWLIHAYDRLEREGAIDHDHAHDDEEDEHSDQDHDHDHGDDDHNHDSERPAIAVDDLTDDDRKITGIYLRLPTRGGSDASAVLPQVFDQLRRDPSIVAAQPTQQIDNLFTIVSNIDQIFLALAAAVMVSSGIAVMLALYNSMEQRRRQIAVLRVLGASRWRIFGLVVTESAMIGLMGAIGGLALAHLGAWIVAAVMKQRLGLVIEPAIEPRILVMIVLATVALAATAGLLPAIMAYRTPVARNLKPVG